jgi:CTP:molybdopterin cytidylyltransferase MocA
MAVPPDAVPVPNPHPERGLSQSLRLGIAAVPEDAAAAVILLGDQPTLEPGAVRRLIGARDPRRDVVATRVGGVLAPPVLLESGAFEIVAGLTGDIGLRDWLRSNAEHVTPVEVEAHPPDVDTPGDLERLRDGRAGA